MSITLDLVYAAIVAVFVFLGLFRGFIKSVIRSAKLILAFVLAYFLGDKLGMLFNNTLVGYILVFIIAFVGLSVVAWLLTAVINKIAFVGLANRILGGAWGALTAALLLTAVSSVIKFFFGDNEIYTGTVLVKFFGDAGLLQIFRFLDFGSLMPKN